MTSCPEGEKGVVYGLANKKEKEKWQVVTVLLGRVARSLITCCMTSKHLAESCRPGHLLEQLCDANNSHVRGVCWRKNLAYGAVLAGISKVRLFSCLFVCFPLTDQLYVEMT